MNDYYSLYTWAMDKQAHLEREATQRQRASSLALCPPARRRAQGSLSAPAQVACGSQTETESG